VSIFIRVIVSWIGLEPGNPVVIFIHDITEPILAPIRQFMPRMGMLDLSPMIAIIVLQLIGRAALMFLS
jgi:YggT family protein